MEQYFNSGKRVCRETLLCIPLFLLISQISLCQVYQTWGVKFGINFTNQVFEDIPVLNIRIIGSQTDTSFRDYGGGYNRAGISLLLYKEFAPSRTVSLVAGIGYRQRGFAGKATYNRQYGWLEQLPEGQENQNRFDNAYVDLAVKLRLNRFKYVVPYFLLGNRIDGRLASRSEFWGDDYPYLTRLELSPVGGAGVEIPLKGVYLSNKISRKEKLTNEPTCLTIEIEVNPGIMNVHAAELTNSNVKIIPGTGAVIVSPRKGVTNQSFGFSAGIKF
jgi:hypothetical protein